MADRVVRFRLETIVSNARQGFQTVSREAKETGRQVTESATRSKEAWNTVGKGMAATGAAIALGLGVAGKAAIDFESSFAGVRKTVDASEAEFARLADGMRSMAREIPTNVNELNAIGEAAGQLGIQTGALLGFTRTMADLGETTNLTSDQAATSLARLANITQMPQSEFDRLGSTIVALGNNFATTESEIVDMAMRLAGAGAQVGMTEAQILAMSTSLTSLGINAEAGGTALSKVMIDIASQVANGGDQVAMFAKVAGMSAAEFSAAWESDAAGALGAFVTGLGQMEARGGTTLQVLEELEITEVRMRDALLRASGAGELWAQAGDLANEAWDKNVALTEEAAQRYGTVEARIQLARNAINDAAITLGQAFAPAIGNAADLAAGFAGTIADMPGPAAAAVTAVGGLAGAASLAAGGFLLALPRIQETRKALATLATDMPKAHRALRGVGSFLTGPWGAALGAGVIALGLFSKARADARREIEEFKATLDEETAAVTDNTRTHAVNVLQKKGLITASRELGVSMQDVVDAALGDEDAFRRIAAAAAEANRQFGYFDEDGIWRVDVGMRNAAVAGDQLVTGLGGVSDSLSTATAEARELAEANAEAEGRFVDVQHAIDAGYDPVLAGHIITQQRARDGINGTTDAIDDQAGGFDEARQSIEDYITQLEALVNPVLGLRDAVEKQQEAQATYAEVMADSESTIEDRRNALWDMIEADAAAEVAALRAGGAMGDFAGWLEGWIRQSDLTEAEANDLRESFGLLEDQAEDLGRTYRMKILLENFEEITTQLDGVERRARAIEQRANVRTDSASDAWGQSPGRMHTGGWVTHGMRPARDTAAMAGLASDEVPIIAQAGELVLSRQQASMFLSGAGAAGPSSTTNVGRQVSGNTIVVQAADATTGLRAASRELDSYERGYV